MLKELSRNIRNRFKQAGIDTPGLDTRLILKKALGVTDSDLITNPGITPTELELCKINEWVERRIAGEPVSRILGRREFWSLNFKVTPDVLDPRPDTETLVEVALERFASRPPRTILDLGTGSGCILLTLLHEWPQALGIGVDCSFPALEVARDNAFSSGIGARASFYCGSWGECLDQRFDLIVSNPPYIESDVIPGLDPEVRTYDPILALDGGKDGLRAYRTMMPDLKKLLNKGGTALFEIGRGQENNVMRLAEDSGLLIEGVHADSAGLLRVVEISSGDK